MISKIKLKFGPSSGQDAIGFSPGSVTLFVGSNNSGKSLVLSELYRWLYEGNVSSTKILDSIKLDFDEEETFRELYDSLKVELTAQERTSHPNQDKLELIHSQNGSIQSKFLQFEGLYNQLKNPKKQGQFCSNFLSLFVTNLRTEHRLALIKPKQVGNFHNPPTDVLNLLFRDKRRREEVRNILYRAFGKYFVLDITGMPQICARFSDRPPGGDEEELHYASPSEEFHAAAVPATEMSDGVQCYTGIILSIFGGEGRIFLLDEPEAFLHPTLTSQLGEKLCQEIEKRKGNLFVSTHDAHFLMGCIRSGVSVNVVRLTWDGKGATARLLPKEDVAELMRRPLLRAARTMDGLFCKAAVVTEHDQDRTFYEEINVRLETFKDPRAIRDTIFLNGHGKGTLHEIVQTLRRMGVPAAAIVDVDLLKDSGTSWTNLLKAVDIPDVQMNALGQLRGSINKLFQDGKLDMHKGGISLLGETDRVGAESFIKQLAEYGLFVVPIGEVESWLSQLEVSGNKTVWLVAMLERMGQDPNNETYVKPERKDVWDFLGSIREWLSDNDRKGMPDL